MRKKAYLKRVWFLTELRYVAMIILIFATGVALLQGQELLDRVVAQVNGDSITLSEVRVAVRLALIEVPSDVDPVFAAVWALINRRLMVIEVGRFPPIEPDVYILEREVERLRTMIGNSLDIEKFIRFNGLTDTEIRELARENLRIQAYLDQRFGTRVYVTEEEVAQYYSDHPDEFQHDGGPMTFADAAPVARERASAVRRQITIEQWLRDLRDRADIKQ